MTLHCPTCSQLVPEGGPEERGLLINKIATLGARIVECEARLQHLRNGHGDELDAFQAFLGRCES